MDSRLRIFISSTFKDVVDGVESELRLRARIVAEAAQLPVDC